MKGYIFKLNQNIPSKKNELRRGKYGNFYQAKQNELNDLVVSLKQQKRTWGMLRPLEGVVAVDIAVFGSDRADLNNQISSLLDCLQEAEIISNDRNAKIIHAVKGKTAIPMCIINVWKCEPINWEKYKLGGS